jgi:hypothetical protein
MINLSQVFRSCGSNSSLPSLKKNDWPKLQAIMERLSQSTEGYALNAALIKKNNGFILNEKRFETGGKICDSKPQTMRLYFKGDEINVNDPFHINADESLLKSFLQHNQNMNEANFILLNSHGYRTETSYSLKILKEENHGKKLKTDLYDLKDKIIWLNSCYETEIETAPIHLQKCLTEKMSNSLAENLSAKGNTVIASSFRLPCWFIHEINSFLQKKLPFYSGLSIGQFFLKMIKGLCREFLPFNANEFREKYETISECKKKIHGREGGNNIFPEDFLAPLFLWIYGSANICLPYCAEKIFNPDDFNFINSITEKKPEPDNIKKEKTTCKKGNKRLFIGLIANNGGLLGAINNGTGSLWIIPKNEHHQQNLIAVIGENKALNTEIINFIIQDFSDKNTRNDTTIIFNCLPEQSVAPIKTIKEFQHRITVFDVFRNSAEIDILSADDLWLTHPDIEEWLEKTSEEYQNTLSFFYPAKEQLALLYLADCGLYFPKLNPKEPKNKAALKKFTNKINA